LDHIFFNGALTGAMYNDFFQNTLPQLLENVDLAIDNACGCNKTAFLIMLIMCKILWIRCSSIVGLEGWFCSWSSRSFDLTLLDFFFGITWKISCIKNSLQLLTIWERIMIACASIQVMTFMQTEKAFTERFRLCMHMRRRQFELYR